MTEEEKAMISEFQSLVKGLREKFEDSQKGLCTKADLEAYQAKMAEKFTEIETKLNRPGVETREPSQPSAAKAAFWKYAREGVAGLTREEKALISDATGQILIPEELESEIYRELPKVTVIRSLATVRTIRSDRIRRRSMTEVQVGWGKLETGAPLNESTQVPSEAYQYVEDLYGLTKIGEDELQDADVSLEPQAVDSFSRAIGEAEDTGFVVGTGHANQQPEGILNGAVVARVDAGQAAAVTVDDFKKVIYAVPAQYRRNGSFITASTTELALALLKDEENRYLWQPTVQAGRPNTFLGYPIYNQEDVPAIPQAGNAADVAIFGDVRAGYRVIDRLGLTVQRLTELYAEDGLIGLKAHFRVGGGVIRATALRVLKVPAA